MKAIKNKMMLASVSSLATIPLLSSCVPTSVLTSMNKSEVIHVNGVSEETKHQACTITYIGKNCTTNKCAIIARATDSSPKAVHLKLKHYKRDELANKVLEGKLGLKYTMPEHTYAYTSCPLSDKTSDDPTWATGNWENNCINEMGVGVSCTLTCYSNNKILDLPNERFIDAGVGEELLNQITIAQASTAKEAMLAAAKAIDQYGAQDANIIMSVDQNEAWLMEIYSRHQYCAIKLPDDKVCIAGNEFILDKLADLGITENNPEDCIVSDGLLSVPKDAGLAVFDDGEPKDVYHLRLFDTYANEGKSGGVAFDPGCHRRTWRGYSMFDQSSDYPRYEQAKKYAPFLTPKDKLGNPRTDMSVQDVFQVYRDEFDDIVDPDSPRYDEIFYRAKVGGLLRPIAVQQTRAVHIMSSDPTKPKWIAANEWYTPDSANYVPYLQFNNAVESFDGEYGYYPDRFEFDEDCSAVLFRELNKLAWYDRENYGYPLQDFWRIFEDIYVKQMQQVTDDVVKLSSVNDAKNIVNNFNKHCRDEIIKQVRKTKDDLMWHIMDQPHIEGNMPFVPLIDVKNFVKELGWKDYTFDGSKATFKRNTVEATYTVGSGEIYSKGTLSLNDGTTVQLRESIVDDKLYVDGVELYNKIGSMSEIRNIEINDYLDKSFNHWLWAGPLIGVVVLAGGATAFYFIRKKKKAKVATSQPLN